ncbi:MAG: hypothetical protein ABEI58_04045 [Candidatus Nanohaloarchaea archaeon]
MKFELFGRLRDNEDGEEQDTGAGGGFQAPQDNQGQDMELGGSLQRTVENMFQQGYAEEEIKQELRGQYSPEEIDNAITNAVADTAGGGANDGGPQPMTPYQGSDEAASPMDEGYGDSGNDDNSLEPDTGALQDTGGESDGSIDPRVEELIETIVAENLDRVRVEFENVYEEIDEIREGVEDLEQRVHDLEVRDDEDQQEFVQKVDEMEDHLDSYQSRIGGLEKAFQQVLPSLVDNVRDLTELVQEIKQEKGIETSKNVSKEDIDDVNLEDW